MGYAPLSLMYIVLNVNNLVETNKYCERKIELLIFLYICIVF